LGVGSTDDSPGSSRGNWRPVDEIEQETKMIEADIEKLDRLISKLDALSRRSDFNSQTQSSTDSN
jgi:hypothetical protein